MPRITLTTPTDLDTIGPRWRTLEAAADASFFQSWSWTGCLAATRFPAPLLIEAEQDGETIGLALLNRRGATLWLGETGDAAIDTIFIEHNAPLVARHGPPELAAAMLAAARTRSNRIALSGIAPVLAAEFLPRAGTIRTQPDRPAPYIDFAPIRAAGQDYAASLSANTRYQLGRSLRRYAEAGPVTITAAADVPQALAFLDQLGALHQVTWQSRGRPGAFANPFFRRFHEELIARALPRGEVELLHIAAGGETIGYLYNFLWRGWSAAYQSGFAYPADDQHRKPGVTCHHQAIIRHFARGGAGYDFLAGEGRYKSSLANAETTLHWLEIGPIWRRSALAARVRAMAGRGHG